MSSLVTAFRRSPRAFPTWNAAALTHLCAGHRRATQRVAGNTNLAPTCELSAAPATPSIARRLPLAGTVIGRNYQVWYPTL